MNKIIFNIISLSYVIQDAPFYKQYLFQDPATDTFEKMIHFHHDVLFIMYLIFILILWFIIRIHIFFLRKNIYKNNIKLYKVRKPEIYTKDYFFGEEVHKKFFKKYIYLNHNTKLEVIWTIIPTIIIGMILGPSILLLGIIHENCKSYDFTVKVVGSQWFWSYEYPSYYNHNKEKEIHRINSNIFNLDKFDNFYILNLIKKEEKFTFSEKILKKNIYKEYFKILCFIINKDNKNNIYLNRLLKNNTNLKKDIFNLLYFYKITNNSNRLIFYFNFKLGYPFFLNNSLLLKSQNIIQPTFQSFIDFFYTTYYTQNEIFQVLKSLRFLHLKNYIDFFYVNYFKNNRILFLNKKNFINYNLFTNIDPNNTSFKKNLFKKIDFFLLKNIKSINNFKKNIIINNKFDTFYFDFIFSNKNKIDEILVYSNKKENILNNILKNNLIKSFLKEYNLSKKKNYQFDKFLFTYKLYIKNNFVYKIYFDSIKEILKKKDIHFSKKDNIHSYFLFNKEKKLINVKKFLNLSIRKDLFLIEKKNYSKNHHINIKIFQSNLIPTLNLRLGEFRLLEVDKRLILPINTNIRILVTSSDVLHSFSVPSLGIKVDACPGRLNEFGVLVYRTSVFYGQCSEICGILHGFMPIVVQTVSLLDFYKYIYINQYN